ncbi:MAG: energy transducer TonB [Proteobacteria bacterium]|nr:energy transducer TonB [Pseudomonadota bacterium]
MKFFSLKSDQVKSFIIAAILHALLLAVLLMSFKKPETPPAVIALDIAFISEVKKEKKSKQIHHQKNFSQEREKHLHQESESIVNDSEKKVKLVANPLPEIPQDLRTEAFESSAIARFYIDANGQVTKVELIKPCANPRLNNLLLKSLRKWEFSKNSTSSIQDIRVKFKVE